VRMPVDGVRAMPATHQEPHDFEISASCAMSYVASIGSWPRSVFACAMAISAHSGCGSEDTCNAIAVVVPVITVTDGTTGKPICDATVMASCADGGAALVAFGPGGYPVDAAVPGCNYGPGLQNGCDVSTVTASKTGYKTVTVPNVEVRYSTHCPGPIPDAQQVGVALEPD
jgi:hypothetical protein